MPTAPPRHQPPGQQQKRAQIERERQVNNGWYRCARWRHLRKAFVAEFPLCKICLEQDNIICKGDQVDHIIPDRLAPDRRYDRDNLQHLCLRHHQRKSAKEGAAASRDEGK